MTSDSHDSFRHVIDKFFDGFMDELSQDNPEWAGKLRDVLQNRGEKSPSGSITLADHLRERFGIGVDPHIEVDAPPQAQVDENARVVLEELRERSPRVRRYEIVQEQARGSMGAILNVWDRDLRRSLAMKVMLDQGAKQSSIRSMAKRRRISRFLEEAQITSQLEHPGIVPLHELGIDSDDRLFFTMQFVKGQTLAYVLDEFHSGSHKWTLTRVLDILLRASEAVAYAHSKGVIHRDLKPSNIMVGEFGEAYVMDWGVAKILGHDSPQSRENPVDNDAREPQVLGTRRHQDASYTLDGDVIGTPVYMPPEQAAGDTSTVGTRSDIYAIGAILYHVLSGQMPYVRQGERLDQIDVLDRVRQGPPRPLSKSQRSIPVELIAICEKAMARAIEDRYGSVLELVADLRAFEENRVVKAYQVGAIVEFRKWVLRNRAFASSLLVIFVSLAAFAILQIQTTKTIREKNVSLTQKERELRESLDLYRRLADVKIVSKLLQEQESMWPRRPEILNDLEEWLEEANDVVARLPEHRERLSWVELHQEGSTENAWQFEVATELVRNLEELNSSQYRGIPAIENRLEIALSVEEISLEESAAKWEEAIQSIETSPVYGGLSINPQLGLIPLGQNESSGLWEFWLWESGDRPARVNLEGKYEILAETGMVFVLLPGGYFDMGSSRDPDHEQYDPYFVESPFFTDLLLDPFFISKYEMTIGQWRKVTSQEESVRANSVFPVTQVTWTTIAKVIPRLGLTFPTEAQWEYAARGGTKTIWFVGNEDSYKELQHFANLADMRFAELGDDSPYEEWSDGYRAHAPVGSFSPNPFGLYDSMGNVHEWCLDGSIRDDLRPRDGDGMVESETRRRQLKGGSYRDRARRATSGFRSIQSKDLATVLNGVRPVRLLD